jgi:hypothetical protein
VKARYLVTGELPDYRALPELEGSTERHAWDVFGRDDQVGTVGLIGPDEVRAAAELIRYGQVVLLSAPLDQPAPGLFANRSVYEHHVRVGSHGRDDHVDGFYMQFSSQWDGLRHVRYRHYGFFGGRQDEAIDSGGELGIERWAQQGIFGRGVLLDAKRFFEENGDGLPADRLRRISGDDLDEIARSEGVEVRRGDIVMVRTGWLEWYLDLPDDGRQALRGTVGRAEQPLECPGLHSGPDTVAWLWDHHVAAVAADNSALEALPVDRQTGFMHYRLIPLLGMAIGELWWLAELSEVCRSRGRYEFFFSSGVLNLPGGVGSPSNAYALF